MVRKKNQNYNVTGQSQLFALSNDRILGDESERTKHSDTKIKRKKKRLHAKNDYNLSLLNENENEKKKNPQTMNFVVKKKKNITDIK